MSVNQNTITKAKLARVRELDFALKFTDSVNKLIEALGVTRKEQKVAGTVIKAYKASGTLENTVAEGEVIPLSAYKVEPVTLGEVTWSKRRKKTTGEAIAERGFDQAVIMTDERMLKDEAKAIRTKFFTFLATGTGTAAGATLQPALANAWGKLQVLFEDDQVDTVFFLNPMDVAAYLGSASVTVQTAFGMSYIENFLGLGTVILNSSVPTGKFYATAKDNIVLYYVPANGADLGEAFDFTADETGYIGIHESADYEDFGYQTMIVSAMGLFAEKLDGVIVGTIGTAAGE